ncbi:MAG: protein kinase [Candidatus Zixiibacteriota bacterium]|nr:MAG: protein kinase [candidate division Zixibacteria bacterium]
MVSRLVGGRYEITGKIGEGGTARIFLAVDKSSDRRFALKIPGEDNRKINESLKKEYFFAFTHTHPSLLKPHDIIYDEDRPVIITPYLEGPTIDKYMLSLKNHSESAAYFSITRKIFATILEAAQFIHFSGYCYNDFKPSNIIAHGDNDKSVPEIALMDFNLVTAASDKPRRKGTLHYLAPEVIRGHGTTRSSDIYSMGVLFYQLLAGVLPFESENESELIENIAETGRVDMNNVPACFREGLESMLNRDPDRRPSDARQAAKVLGVDGHFDTLEKSRMEYYLASGPAPFAEELKRKFDSFRKFDPGKLFIINGYSYSGGSLDFQEAQYRIEKMDCFRIHETDDDERIEKVLENSLSAAKTDRREKILLIDNLESFANENLRKLAKIIENPHNIHIAAAAGRWFRSGIKHEIFDPIKYWRRMRMTEESLKAFLKRDYRGIDLRPLSESTGGDPEQIFYLLKHTGGQKGLDYLMAESGDGEFRTEVAIPENEYFYSRLLGTLNDKQGELISMLSAWGNTIPLLMFVKFERDKHELVEDLAAIGILIRHRDSVSFLSGGLRKYVYNLIPDSEQQRYHRFWALNAEELISDNNERLELTAYHWALSGDIQQSYRFNAAAAKEFYKCGNYIKAEKFAKTLINCGINDPADGLSALEINGDINRAMGYSKTARKMYIDILLNERDIKTRCEIYKKLGELYLLSGNYKKSLHYIKRTRDYPAGAKDDIGFSECNEIMALAWWHKKDYLLSLEHLLKTAGKYPAAYESGRRERRRDSENDAYDIMTEALEISKKLVNHRMTIRSHNELGQYHAKNGDFDDAVGQFKKALEISEKTGRKNEIIESLLNLGSCHLISGDLFMAIECFQDARQIAETSCNIRLKTVAELKLTDVSVEMGNFSLALSMLKAIENDRIYNEDKLLRLMTDLRKARIRLALGDGKASLTMADRISRSAAIMEKHELKLQAEIVAAESRSEALGTDNIENLKVIFSKAKKNDLTDLVAELQLSLGKYYKDHNNRYNALHYFEDICEAKWTPRSIRLRAEIIRTEILAEQGNYQKAAESLIETESVAAASGYIPIALQACESESALQKNCGRIDLYEECNLRADGYREKLLSALPEGYAADRYRKRLILSRAENSTEAQTGEEPRIKKEFSMVSQ